MPIREQVDRAKLNKSAVLPHQLRLIDFETAMQDVYDFLLRCKRAVSEEGPSKVR